MALNHEENKRTNELTREVITQKGKVPLETASEYTDLLAKKHQVNTKNNG